MDGDSYECTECGREAPALDSLEILDWEGGEVAHFLGEDDPLMLALVCPECVEKRAAAEDAEPQ